MPKKTYENKEKLAEAIIKSWNAEKLLSFAIQTLVVYYNEKDSLFNEDWNLYMED